MRSTFFAPLAASIIIIGIAAAEDGGPDLALVQEIKAEAFERSKVMEHLSYLTDVNGPRLTASANHVAAGEWAAERLKSYGLVNVALEPWGPFGRSWRYEKLRIDLVAPQYVRLHGFPLAWSEGILPSTLEPMVTPIERKRDPSKDKDELAKFKAKWKGKLKGKLLMMTEPKPLAVPTAAAAKRYTDQELAELAEAPLPIERKTFDYSKLEVPEDPQTLQQYWLGAPPDLWDVLGKLKDERNADFHAFLREEGAAALVQRDGRGDGGTTFGEAAGPYKEQYPLSLPTFVFATEDYDRVARLIEMDQHPKVALELAVTASAHDQSSFNVVAEIPGQLKPDEVVMVGGHLDSWVGGTGATDNGAGSAVAMEVARILKSLDRKPDRTIRVALWGGEEQGLHGSRAYVAKHFGDPLTMKLEPEHEKLSAYFNLDNGTGKIRGVYLQGNDAARPIFEKLLAPFHDLGAKTISIRPTGGTDHLSFDAVGLPGFQFIQDPLDYSTRTHHSDLDVYDHVQPGDLMQASAIMAYCVSETAHRAGLFPRKQLPKARPRLQPAEPVAPPSTK